MRGCREARNTLIRSRFSAARRKAWRIRRSLWMLAWLLFPWVSAFFAQRALPAAVFGRVERRQGCQKRISTA